MKLSLIGNKAHYEKMSNDEFTLNLFSLASFRIFCKEEIILDGDWRVAFSEINIATKRNRVTDQEFTYFRGSGILSNKSNAGNRNHFPGLIMAENFYQIRRVHF